MGVVAKVRAEGGSMSPSDTAVLNNLSLGSTALPTPPELGDMICALEGERPCKKPPAARTTGGTSSALVELDAGINIRDGGLGLEGLPPDRSDGGGTRYSPGSSEESSERGAGK